MRILPKEFTSKGFTYRQLWRDEKRAVYEQRKAGHASVAFEAVKIALLPAASYEIKGRKITHEAGEYYPRTEDWGIYGFTFTNLQAAIDKAQTL